MGALIIILALATEPFTQQIIRPTVSDHVASNVTALISKANALATTGLLTPQDDYGKCGVSIQPRMCVCELTNS